MGARRFSQHKAGVGIGTVGLRHERKKFTISRPTCTHVVSRLSTAQNAAHAGWASGCPRGLRIKVFGVSESRLA